ncbi:MAG: aminotransferase class V-fold PLP-dependent enzyme, partial [Pirellulaceae bacterium]
SDALPGYLNYKHHDDEDSMWNTPPTFAVYVLGLVMEWLETTIGGMDAMHRINHQKAAIVYEAMDRHPQMFRGHARPSDRSLMNATFSLPSEALESVFLAGAQQRGLDSLHGHRSVGGIRASIYNAMPLEGTRALAAWMDEFADAHPTS